MVVPEPVRRDEQVAAEGLGGGGERGGHAVDEPRGSARAGPAARAPPGSRARGQEQLQRRGEHRREAFCVAGALLGSSAISFRLGSGVRAQMRRRGGSARGQRGAHGSSSIKGAAATGRVSVHPRTRCVLLALVTVAAAFRLAVAVAEA